MKMLGSPSHCDERNSSFSTTHALSCKVGDLIHSCHDESRDSAATTNNLYGIV